MATKKMYIISSVGKDEAAILRFKHLLQNLKHQGVDPDQYRVIEGKVETDSKGVMEIATEPFQPDAIHVEVVRVES